MMGEKFNWYRLASHLGISLQRCQQETTSNEFDEWMVFLDMEEKAFKPIHAYLAQIAFEIVRVKAKHPTAVKFKSFILDFTNKVKKILTKAEATKIAKDKWFAVSGYKKPKE